MAYIGIAPSWVSMTPIDQGISNRGVQAWIGYFRHRGLLWPPILMVIAILATSYLSTTTEVKLVLWLSFGIAALSLDFVWGRAGIFSFGQNALFGIGGYIYAIAALNLYPTTGETISALLLGGVAAGAFAAFLGYVMFYGRVGDVYLAIVTLAVTLVLYTVMSSTAGPEYHVGEAQLGGFNGMPSLPTITLGIPGLGNGQELGVSGLFIFAVCLGTALYIILRLLVTSGYGQILAGIRENETRMELLGYDIRFNKLLAFVIGGAVAGFGGGLFAAWGTFINPAVFALTQAAMVVIWVMVGGRGSLAGAFLGVVVVQWVSDTADQIVSEQTPLILGVMLLLVVLLFPRGLAPSIEWLFERLIQPLRHWLSLAPPSQRLTAGPITIPSHRVFSSCRPESLAPRAGHLVAQGVSKRFGGVAVLQNVTLEFGASRSLDQVTVEFGPSRICAIIGPNGAGKTTFFGALTGRQIVSAGRIELNGTDITRLAPFRRARLGLGIKLQVPCIFQGLTVHENLELAARASRAPGGRERAEKILDVVGLADKRWDVASTLSHGQQQWLEIALVLAQNPSVILLDEPAAGMTQEERLQTLKLIYQLAATHTTVVVEHDMAFVQALRAPIVMLHRGQVFRVGSFDQLSNDPQVIDAYLGKHRDA